MAEELYNSALKEFTNLILYNSRYFSYLNLYEEISKHGFTCDFTVAKQQIKNQIDMNINLMQEWKKTIDKYENEIKEFSINILVTPQKQVYLSRHNNIVKV